MTAQRFPVEPSHIMMFARAVGDDAAVYHDPTAPETERLGGIVAPPTFAIAGAQFDPDHPLRPNPPEPWFGSGADPSGAEREGAGRLHAEQHFEYHRPLRAGDVLRGVERAGDTWEKQSRRGGTLRFEEFIVEYRDAATDELVITSRMVGVLGEPAVAPEVDS